MTEYNKLSQILKDKSILYIPIYSCFNYQTSLLNFKADGNINRFLSTFMNCDIYKDITILEPIDGVDKDWFNNVCQKYLNNCNLVECPLIKKSAKVERSIEFSFDLVNFFKEMDIDLNSFDYIICEAQHVFLRLYNLGYINKLIYWCPVCATNNKTRDFLEPYKEIDKYIFSISNISIVASNEQVKYYNSFGFNYKLIQINKLIDRNLPIFDYEVNQKILNLVNKKYKDVNKIYLPFRLTDMGYKTQEIIDYLYNDYKFEKTFIVLYSNPNNCDIYQFANGDSYKKLWLDRYFIQVSKSRDTYYTIIDKGNVIIPYFEDTEFIAHASVNEFKYGNCKVVKSLDEFIKSFK